jgi:hypothetical protein
MDEIPDLPIVAMFDRHAPGSGRAEKRATGAAAFRSPVFSTERPPAGRFIQAHFVNPGQDSGV